MAVRFETSKPQVLLDRIKKAIDDGDIDSWSYDSDGDFTQTNDTWENKAWFRSSVGREQLSFYIIPPIETVITRKVYAVFHARLIESVLTYCDDAFRRATATALPEGPDQVKGKPAPDPARS